MVIFRAVWALTAFVGLTSAFSRAAEGPPPYDRAAAVRADLLRSDAPDILVTAHRSDWRNAPENSLAAMRRAIQLGVDLIEVDVRPTKDGRFVIIHDLTLERTTDGKGRVADHTLAELRQMHLLAATGHPTSELIPTLEEALEVARGKVLVNLDKSFDHPAEILAVVKRCQAVDFCLFSVDQRLDVFERLHPGFLAQVTYMIVVPLWRPDARVLIDEYLARGHPAVVQVTFNRDRLPLVRDLKKVRQHGARLWINSIWPEQNGGHDDERALTDPEGAYGWLIATGANMIQTDRPQYLLEYLRAANRHR